MKKIFTCMLGFVVIVGSFLFVTPVKASDPVVDQEFTPNFNYYGRDNSVFLRACSRFKPTKSTYATYFDLAVKNDRAGDYPIRASFRTAVSDTIPSETIYKYFIQTTFKNYAMSEGFSRFTAEDGKTSTMDTGKNYFICIEELWNDNATGWFYTNPASGKYSILGFTTDVPTYLENVSFGFRTYGYNPDPGQTPTVNTGGNTNSNTTNNGSNGNAPSSNPSSSIAVPTSVAATYSAADKGVSVAWKASTTSNITGYQIYRTKTAGKSYAKVGTTTKSVLQYIDSTVEKNTTYYYIVRTYKDTSESYNSNEAKVDVPADAVIVAQTTNTPTVTPTTEVVGQESGINWWLWGGIGLLIILLGLLVFLIIRRKKQAKPAKS